MSLYVRGLRKSVWRQTWPNIQPCIPGLVNERSPINQGKVVDLFGSEIFKQPNYKSRAKTISYFIAVAEVSTR